MKFEYYCQNIFINYFWLYSISAVFLLLTGFDWIFNIGFPLVIWGMLYKSRTVLVRGNIFDYLWIANLIWIVFTWIINDYEHQGIIIFYTCITHISYMFVYWIARKSDTNYLTSVIRHSFIPLLITSLLGIYCFIFRPSWYLASIQQSAEGAGLAYDENVFSDMFRLRSIFGDAYSLAYFSAITLIFLCFYIIKGHWRKESLSPYFLCTLIISLILVSLLCMMRAPMFCAVIGFFFAITQSQKTSTILKVFIVTTVISFVTYRTISTMVDPVVSDYFVEKIEEVFDDDDDYVDYRFRLMEVNETLCGDGVGRHSIRADSYNPGTMLPDGEYMKILAEEGYIGLTMIFILFAGGLVYGLKNRQDLYLEASLLIMLFICMIGANPLSTANKHCFIYWLALGQIARFFERSNHDINLDTGERSNQKTEEEVIT